jgi:hypothetical protein
MKNGGFEGTRPRSLIVGFASLARVSATSDKNLNCGVNEM